MRRLGSSLVLIAALSLIGSSVAMATPAPTEPPRASGGQGGGADPSESRRTPAPTAAPSIEFDVPAPARPNVLVGYTGNEIMAQAPLLVAEEAGYFEQVGLDSLIVARTPDVLEDVKSGDLDIAVVPATEAFAAVADDPTLRVIAGYRNYTGDGDYRGEVLLAAPGFVQTEPTTVGAFLAAYIQALQLFTNEAGQAVAYDLIDATSLVFRKTRNGWARSVQVYEPYDGGFGDREDEGGLGELGRHLSGRGGSPVDPAPAIATDALAMTQVRLGLSPNPEHPYAGLPGIANLSVAMDDPDDPTNPISVAVESGAFTDAGFESVEIIEADEPLLGVLQGQVDFAVMDTRDVAEATSQGLPLAAIAGHRNYTESGGYGDDVVVASRDLIEQEGSTVAAFLITYVQALLESRGTSELAVYAPHDGGFGDPEQAGGLGELADYLGVQPDELQSFADTGPLGYVQAWHGVPRNPTALGDSSTEDR